MYMETIAANSEDIFADLTAAAPQSEARTATITEIRDDQLAKLLFSDGSELWMPVTEYRSDRQWRVGESLVVLRSTDAFGERSASAVSADLVGALAATFIPELRTGEVRIMGTARAPGIRSKIAVATTVESVDPLAACIGRAASRIKGLCAVLGERVDVVLWHEDPCMRAASALAPAQVLSSQLVGEDGVECTVAAHQMASAVGDRGLNTQLAGQLAGLFVTIVPAGG
jgi:transcription antitermination factor NusA-like protein